MEFTAFIDWLRGPGINAAIGFLMSFVVEWFPRWDDLAPRIKRLVMLAFCMALPLLATLLGTLTGYLDSSFALTWWPALVSGLAAFASSTVAHARQLS